MSTEKGDKARKLLAALGEIDDFFLDEAETADIATRAAARRRVVQYSALGAGVAASLGIALTCLVIRAKGKRLLYQE